MAKTETTKTFGERLSELVELKRDSNYTTNQKKQAEEMNVPYSSFRKYLNDGAECGISYLVQIAKYYDVSTDFLLGTSDTPTTDPNVQMICEYTGLSKEAVDFIKEVNSVSIDLKNNDSRTFDISTLLEIMFKATIKKER